MFKKNNQGIMFAVFALLSLTVSLSALAELEVNLGERLSEQSLEPFDITVFPSGKNLPKGRGDVLSGQHLYQAQCQLCHGESGTEGPAARLSGSDGWFSLSDPLRVLRIKKYPILLISAGAMWPYATSLFDYIRRAMPHYAPKSLSNDDVYALTAYVLYLNELIDESASLDENSILTIEMPGLKRSVINEATQKKLKVKWPWPDEGKSLRQAVP